MELIPVIKKDEALIREMDELLPDTANAYIWWLGQSGFLLQWNGKRILLDPYLSDALTQKYQSTAKPHVRMSERVTDPALLTNISIVTSSHNHTDHLDAATLLPILKNNPGVQLLIPAANRQFVCERLQCDPHFPIGLNDAQSVTLQGFTFYGIPAKHNEIDRDENGCCKYMGYVIFFGPYKIYHSGDTLWFDEMVDILKPFSVDLALLPINGNEPGREVAGNLDCTEAVKLAKVTGAKTVIPCHYDMFAFNTADVNKFAVAATETGQDYCILKGGEYFKLYET